MPKFPPVPVRTPFNQKGINPRVRSSNGSAGTQDEQETIVSAPWTRWFNQVQTNLSSGYAVLPIPLPVASGGTGQTTFIGSGLPSSVATPSLDDQTVGVGPNTIVTPVAGTQYFIGIMAKVESPTGTSTLTLSITWTYDTNTVTQSNIINFSATTSNGAQGASVFIQADGGTNVQYTTTFVNGGGADNYDLEMRILSM